jgi:hypothetical protein
MQVNNKHNQDPACMWLERSLNLRLGKSCLQDMEIAIAWMR